ncbi:hypothetical protein GEMRC1_004612 [Eukaryota sp. GEM-RC1]
MQFDTCDIRIIHVNCFYSLSSYFCSSLSWQLSCKKGNSCPSYVTGILMLLAILNLVGAAIFYFKCPITYDGFNLPLQFIYSSYAAFLLLPLVLVLFNANSPNHLTENMVPISILVVIGALMAMFYICNPTLSQTLDAHTLGHFNNLVDLPKVSVPLELDEKIASLSTNTMIVLAGQSGCGKSVSLFNFLKKKTCVVVASQLNLKLGLSALNWTEKQCFGVIRKALRTNKYSLVIDDAELIHPGSLLFQLIGGYGGEGSLPFPIYLTVTDCSAYNTNLIPKIKSNVVEFWFDYPNATVIRNLTSLLGLDYYKIIKMVGPSLRFINQYVTSGMIDSVVINCNRNVGKIAFLESVCRTVIQEVL